MAKPSIESRLKRRFIVMSGDHGIVAELRNAMPAGWEMRETLDLDAVGGFQDVLQHRFILLDLDEREAFAPVEVIRQVRTEHMLNVAIFCFGGTPDVRDEARLARADRFFEREEIATRLPLFCEQFGW
ncbi:MAG: hypothetical protein A3G24_10815 [Betaproteobacteria bacterium RIFCSPLOWO2_12_FULL_62_13]|nr:MAG: hypothetical protein A3G24_10815 [Betaproteobacteria bacterium RIFCSPLOWO2_12_FULL_62_13]